MQPLGSARVQRQQRSVPVIFLLSACTFLGRATDGDAPPRSAPLPPPPPEFGSLSSRGVGGRARHASRPTIGAACVSDHPRDRQRRDPGAREAAEASELHPGEDLIRGFSQTGFFCTLAGAQCSCLRPQRGGSFCGSTRSHGWARPQPLVWGAVAVLCGEGGGRANKETLRVLFRYIVHAPPHFSRACEQMHC